MKILAVTCLTGGEDLVVMAEEMLSSLRECIPAGVDLMSSCVTQGAARRVDGLLVDCQLVRKKNLGFAAGMNDAIDNAVNAGFNPDRVLCLNTDLQFPDKDWLRKLIQARPIEPRILCPATDKTALYKQDGPKDNKSFDEVEVSAYCWLVPFKWCLLLLNRYRFWLFDPEFFAFGEDNQTAFILAKWFGPKVFHVVPRSFVKHLRHKTSEVVKPDRRASSRLLREFFQDELKNPKLRSDLKSWAQRYVRVLKP